MSTRSFAQPKSLWLATVALSLSVFLCSISFLGPKVAFGIFDESHADLEDDKLFAFSHEHYDIKPFTSSDRILVTGASGFIGMHFILLLLLARDKGGAGLYPHQIAAIDEFNSYYSVALKRARSEKLRQAGVDVLNISTCAADEMKDLLINQNTTHFVHFAAQPGVRYARRRPDTYIERNIVCFVSVLEAIRKYSPLTYLVYASSSSVYGKNTRVPFSEDHRAELPASLYGATKRTNELLAHTYFQTYGLQSTGLRFFTVYGSWGRPDMALYSFVYNIMHGLPIKVFDAGTMYRDFTHVSDIVSGVLKICQFRSPLSTMQGVPSYHKHKPEVFNLGNSHPVSVNEFIHTIEKHLGKNADKKFATSSADEVAKTYADVRKAWRLLRWKPQMSLDEGIKEFVDW
eukprot:CAMPEP_0184305846 /NCGR_PEP_ID=MMETSP1049-20130417/15012_1 /TAXON_ID=77928 /ORGANISM="Proteomonas sulcata, Strain CCMP704" /LENGTH=401 /DNA_ID=CAMNT_0026617997 /DNA_START=46 /DNA_END=1248 /DNA_ORIENTATION=+